MSPVLKKTELVRGGGAGSAQRSCPVSWDVVGVRHIVEGVREGGGAAAAHRSLVELSFMRAACAGVVCSSCCDVLAVGWYLNVGADAENVGVEGGVLVMGEVVGVSGAAGG